MVKLILPITFVALSMNGGAYAFQTRASAGGGTSTCLNAISRRELFSAVPATAAAAAAMFSGAPAAFAAGGDDKKEALSYQGIFTDPKHPKGYRVLVGGDKGAMMRLQDDPKDEVYNLPIKISKDKKTKEAQFTFDFSPKGGPKDVVAVLGKTEKSGTTTLVFPDGNVWKKETGPIGVYSDGFNPKQVRVIRKDKGSKLTVDLINSPTQTVTLSAKAGNPKILFDFPGKPNDPGTFDATENTLSFGDGNVWTKF